MVSVSACQAGLSGSSPVRSACFRKVEFYKNVINLSPPVLTTGLPKATCYRVYVITHLKIRSCRKSRASCPVKSLARVRKKNFISYTDNFRCYMHNLGLCKVAGVALLAGSKTFAKGL